jgi:leucyl-tRNA synthetase
LQLFNSYFDRALNKANPVSALVAAFEKEGNLHHACPADPDLNFTAAQWLSWDEKAQQDVLMQYRLAFCGFGEVNWCAALGTVLANDEVINGYSERGGHPVEKKKLRQWYLRITEYADRLLAGLDTIQFSDAMKEMQANWIGKSYGAEIDFKVADQSAVLTVYTTRPDTVFGVDFLVVAPEHALIQEIVPASHQQEVNDYIAYVKSRSERERIAEKKITGCFTGAYVVNPFNQQRIPIWISEYVLAGYGTGAIMAVPCGDDRDFKFAQHFNIPITNIIGDAYDGTAANPTKEGILSNSDFLNGMVQKDAIAIVIEKLEAMGIGKKKVNFRMRDAAFSRQRYWGEPFPIQWKNGIAYPLSESELPLLLPTVENYGPGPDGEGPLANIEDWKANHFETNTMPGFAGSSWYFLRYMDPHNTTGFCDRKVSDYWGQVDLYIGGTEHAVGHLLYSRMWTKVLYDLGHIGFDEPFKKLLNQGMIQGSSRFVYRKRGTQVFVSAGLAKSMEVDQLHVDVNIVDGIVLDTEAFKKWKPDYANATFELEDGKYNCGVEVEKMSKSKFNTVNPDVLVEKYGADTFRMYEMFLGPVEQSKPWDTKGIEGVHRFLKKLWRLFYDEMKGQVWLEEKATPEELKVLHKTIKKIEEDTERHSYNTAVSGFMICVNELFDLGCHKKEILEQLLILLAPYAPHISEELWSLMGKQGLVIDAPFPVFEAAYVTETSKEYPVSINGKVRANIAIDLDATEAQVQEIVLNNQLIQKWIEEKPIKKLIFVKGKMINVVI